MTELKISIITYSIILIFLLLLDLIYKYKSKKNEKKYRRHSGTVCSICLKGYTEYNDTFYYKEQMLHESCIRRSYYGEQDVEKYINELKQESKDWQRQNALNKILESIKNKTE